MSVYSRLTIKMSKKSGAELRKIRKRKEEEKIELAKNWKQCLARIAKVTESNTSGISEDEKKDNVPVITSSSSDVHESSSREISEDEKNKVSNIIASTSTEEQCNPEEEQKFKNINYSDPATWQRMNIYNEHFICALVAHGPVHDTEADFSHSASNDGRHFSAAWFFKCMPNGEKVKRDWLLYSRSKGAVFCFPCLLFSKNSMNSPKIANIDSGFSNWRKMNPQIPDHENSVEHKNAFIKWKELEQCLKLGHTINSDIEKNILMEKNKWKRILTAIIDSILHCAENNLALRGTSDNIDDRQSGMFLKNIRLIAKYDKEIARHVDSIRNNPNRTVSYFSKTIQNEIIHLMGKQIKNKIFDDIREATYFAISFDCTPDISHKEQMVQIIRYVKLTDDGQYKVEERFIDFIESKSKTGEALANQIINKIQTDGLNIENCRAHCYDNGSNMAGKYKGVQARILARNEFAYFVPCTAHSLNLVGVHAASVTSKMMSFFGTVQNLFVFFSSSTERWDILTANLKNFSLKKQSDTRWS